MTFSSIPGLVLGPLYNSIVRLHLTCVSQYINNNHPQCHYSLCPTCGFLLIVPCGCGAQRDSALARVQHLEVVCRTYKICPIPSSTTSLAMSASDDLSLLPSEFSEAVKAIRGQIPAELSFPEWGIIW